MKFSHKTDLKIISRPSEARLGSDPHREVWEFEADAQEVGNDGVEVNVAEGDGADARGRLDAPAALQRLQGPGAEQAQRLSVQLGQVTVGHGQTLNARTAAILQPGNTTENIT